MQDFGTRAGDMTRQLHLNLFSDNCGHYGVLRRHSFAAHLALTDTGCCQDLAQRVVAGLFDAISRAGTLAFRDHAAQAARTRLRPVTVLPAITADARRIGPIATASTTYVRVYADRRRSPRIPGCSAERPFRRAG